MAGFLTPRNEVERRAVLRNITEHRHDCRYSGLVERLTLTDDLAGH
jgi:hypothetical protein